MMRMRLRILTTMALLITSHARSHASNCGPRDISLYFANGMFNTSFVAKRSATKLAAVAGRPAKISYNVNESALLELLQVAEQASEENARLFWYELAGKLEENEELVSDFKIYVKSLRTKMLDLAKSYDRKRYVYDPDLRRHVLSYQDDLIHGRHVSVVAHSQGNFYANSAGELLPVEWQSKYAVMAVATPAKTVFGNGPYLTLARDQPMAAVRSARGSLPANDSSAGNTMMGHDLVEDTCTRRGITSIEN